MLPIKGLADLFKVTQLSKTSNWCEISAAAAARGWEGRPGDLHI